jgi:hypothetical protein
MFFNFVLKYVIKVQENQEISESSGTHHLVVYADDVNLMGVNITYIR